MVLEELVLKLVIYGILQVLLLILPEASAYLTPLVLTMGIISIVYASLTALQQTDFKCLVAMLSVAYMGVVILELFSNTIQDIEEAILLSLAHRFVFPALFFLVGAVIYDQYHSQVIQYYQELTMYMPVFSALFFFFTVTNMGTPTTANWVEEFLSLAGVFQLKFVAALLGATSIVLSASYSIWLYNQLAFRSFSSYLTWTTDITQQEFMVLLTMLISTVFFRLFSNVILVDLHHSVSTLLYKI